MDELDKITRKYENVQHNFKRGNISKKMIIILIDIICIFPILFHALGFKRI